MDQPHNCVGDTITLNDFIYQRVRTPIKAKGREFSGLYGR